MKKILKHYQKIFYTRYDPNNNIWKKFEYRGLVRDENGHVLKKSSNKTYVILFNKVEKCLKKIQIDLLVNDKRCQFKKRAARGYPLIRRIDPDWEFKETKPRKKNIIKGQNNLTEIFENEWSFQQFMNFYNDCENRVVTSSLGSTKISNYLSNKLDIAAKREKKFPECKDKNMLPFDFVIEYCGYTAIIEVDGEQHRKIVKHFTQEGLTSEESFKIVQKHDKIKNDFCKQKGYKLIRLHYQNKNFEYITKQLQQFLDQIKFEHFNN